MVDIVIPVKIVGGERWLLLNHLSKKGVFRAARIDKRKHQVRDWDGHHCDEAVAEGSIRYRAKIWEL